MFDLLGPSNTSQATDRADIADRFAGRARSLRVMMAAVGRVVMLCIPVSVLPRFVACAR